MKDHVAAMFETTQAWTNLFAGTSQAGVVGEGLEARFKFAQVLDGLRWAPAAQGKCSDFHHVGFGAA